MRAPQADAGAPARAARRAGYRVRDARPRPSSSACCRASAPRSSGASYYDASTATAIRCSCSARCNAGMQQPRRDLSARAHASSASSTPAASSGSSRRGGEIRAGKVVLAAGIGNATARRRWSACDVPVRPQRGQLIVTEKIAPFLHYPVATMRQTDEGGVMLGDSQEEAGFDPTVGTRVIAVLADRARAHVPAARRASTSCAPGRRCA